MREQKVKVLITHKILSMMGLWTFLLTVFTRLVFLTSNFSLMSNEENMYHLKYIYVGKKY